MYRFESPSVYIDQSHLYFSDLYGKIRQITLFGEIKKGLDFGDLAQSHTNTLTKKSCLSPISLAKCPRKPVFGVCEQQRHRSACAFAQTDQRLRYSVPEMYHIKLASSEISPFQLVSVAEETGSSLALSETPKKGFVASRPNSVLIKGDTTFHQQCTETKDLT